MFAPVTIYTQPGCGPCTVVKELLEEAGIDYDAVDVTLNSEAYDYVTKVLKLRSTPVIVTDTHDPIVGDDRDKLQDLIHYYTASETGL
ncbi:hypothetical protein MAIC_42550 [Mycolicibacterium aichiense]|uniref:GST N-terminal domain-containing protein n=1 Tax=Mycolicibacterium aichiense TaxID=1799 RepID=A0AAD1MCH5_9MYCO|nr:glutaredoxin domain-containing protein [Mycolicibacterium aichiense]BBX09452.1 hypothetical protein MAIC_42550 [Mycolicibacterium aichiense]